MAKGATIRSRRIDETPVAVIDFETTGLYPGTDRVVEVSVVRVDPGAAPQLVLDTLVNPKRPMDATHIHGIRDRDVLRAPGFDAIACDLLAALSGCVVAAYNARFDLSFLSAELALLGIRHEPPHICLMYMRPLLGLGAKCRLEVACGAHGIVYTHAHTAAADALVSAGLYRLYLDACREQEIQTFGDLCRKGGHKFLQSLRRTPFPHPYTLGLTPCACRCPRTLTDKVVAPAALDTQEVIT